MAETNKDQPLDTGKVYREVKAKLPQLPKHPAKMYGADEEIERIRRGREGILNSLTPEEKNAFEEETKLQLERLRREIKATTKLLPSRKN